MNEIAFDDDGNRIGQTGFDYDALDGEVEPQNTDDARARQELPARLLTWLASGSVDAFAVGRRVLILSHLLSGGKQTQRALARRLRISPSHANALIKASERQIAYLSKS